MHVRSNRTWIIQLCRHMQAEPGSCTPFKQDLDHSTVQAQAGNGIMQAGLGSCRDSHSLATSDDVPTGTLVMGQLLSSTNFHRGCSRGPYPRGNPYPYQGAHVHGAASLINTFSEGVFRGPISTGQPISIPGAHVHGAAALLNKYSNTNSEEVLTGAHIHGAVKILLDHKDDHLSTDPQHLL
eukprot:1158100-Pelagomonas_calceolata.AAC.3